jgi:hypothetical protein
MSYTLTCGVGDGHHVGGALRPHATSTSAMPGSGGGGCMASGGGSGSTWEEGVE